jgi:hypothetical protein
MDPVSFSLLGASSGSVTTQSLIITFCSFCFFFVFTWGFFAHWLFSGTYKY